MSILDLEVAIIQWPINVKTNKPDYSIHLRRDGELVGIVDIDKYAEFDQYKTNVEPPIELVSSQYTIEEVEEDAGD